MTGNSELRRIRLKAPINEASALLGINDAETLRALGFDEGYWLAHDEGGLGGGAARSMMSAVGRDGEEWSIRSMKLAGADGNEPRSVTDAEALAVHGRFVFAIGSGFLGADNKLDLRRAFVTRFSPHELEITPKRVAGRAEVLDLGTALLTAINETIVEAAIELIEAGGRGKKAASKAAGVGPTATPINIEGAACLGSSLLLGLRWPVTASGHPLVVEIEGGADVLSSAWGTDTQTDLADCTQRLHVLRTADASPKKPMGIRGLSVDQAGQLHAITGPTDRDLATTKLKAGAYTHLAIDLDQTTTHVLETFEGYRKVEALAARPMGGWLYGLDDEKAIVLLIGGS